MPTDTSYEPVTKYCGTPLHYAESRNVIERLIEKDCDINKKNHNGQNALQIMVAKGKLDCVTSLLSGNAKINFKDNDGNTALHVAIQKNLLAMVQLLIVFGSNVNARNKLQESLQELVYRVSAKGNFRRNHRNVRYKTSESNCDSR